MLWQPPRNRPCKEGAMATDHPITLEGHRGVAALMAAELRRRVTEVAAGQETIGAPQEELAIWPTAPPATWAERAERTTQEEDFHVRP